MELNAYEGRRVFRRNHILFGRFHSMDTRRRIHYLERNTSPGLLRFQVMGKRHIRIY
ncbi:hypothetical protein GTO27_00975 [Candidatus Bathyarchaeota archaeon]|nr:hypothetical protein [Candidatus Bathyarchaeota archaeon]